jgi:hypothetical protein
MKPNFFETAARVLGGAALVFCLAACASISVQPGKEYATGAMPKEIYVMKFSTAHAEFNVDREAAELSDFKKNLQNVLQVAQVTDLSDRLVPAKAARKDPWSRRENAWLIRGEFIKVNQGSRFLRTAIGFGAGGTKLETTVWVYDLSSASRQPFLTFSTTGGSNAEPGAVTSIATDPLDLAVQIALSGVSGFSHGLTEDTKRTAREITAELSDYMYRSRWIHEDQWIQPKEVSPGDKLE